MRLSELAGEGGERKPLGLGGALAPPPAPNVTAKAPTVDPPPKVTIGGVSEGGKKVPDRIVESVAKSTEVRKAKEAQARTTVNVYRFGAAGAGLAVGGALYITGKLRALPAAAIGLALAGIGYLAGDQVGKWTTRPPVVDYSKLPPAG